MKLAVKARKAGNKSETNELRRKGQIPAILYSKGAPGAEFSIDAIEFQKILNSIPKGTLSARIFDLDVDGRKIKALIKEVQYHRTTYKVLHLDFVELHDDVPVTLNVPIELSGAVDCAGVKLGGVIRQVIRQLKVRTLPKHIPASFQIDVRDLELGASRRLNSIDIPSEIRPITDLKEVAVVISRK